MFKNFSTVFSVIYIEVSEETSFKYTKPVLDWVKSNFVDVVTYDFDNRSDSFMVDYALELVNNADKSVIVFELNENGKTNNLIAFMQGLAKYKKKLLFLYSGKNAIIEKLFKMFLPEKIISCNEQKEQEDRISEYLV